MSGRRILVHTIPPYNGGVPAKTRLLCRHLARLGWDVTVAWYASLGHEPELVAPLWRPLPPVAAHSRHCWGEFPGWAVGCRCPESEVAYYRRNPAWNELIRGFDRHLAVGGNVLVAHRLVCADIPHLLWCATPVEDDRCDRRRAMPVWRQALDRLLITPALKKLEQQVLKRTPVLMPVASYGRHRFTEMGRGPDPVPVLPVPVDTSRFHPGAAPIHGVVGFAGRLADPRKNLILLLDALALAKSRNKPLRARLAGENSVWLAQQVRERGLDDLIEMVGQIRDEDFPDYYRSLDVFVIPSYQEGLGIVGIEAMASGLPVVSTRCGGPEDYVIPGQTGFLSSFAVDELAGHMLAVVENRGLRDQMGRAARDLAMNRFGLERWAEDFATGWQAVWGDRP